MQHLLPIKLLFLTAVVCFACNSKSPSTGSTANADASATSSGSSGSSGFSATIDGVAVSGGAIDEMQLQNTAFLYPGTGSCTEDVYAILYTDKKESDYYAFIMDSPKKEGTYTIQNGKSGGCLCNIKVSFNLKSSDNFPDYVADGATLTIDKVNATRISGTFSGHFKLSDDTRSKPYKPAIEVTNGKFDIPFSTGNMRPK